MIRKFEGRKPEYKDGKFNPGFTGIFGTTFTGITFKCAGRFSRAQMASRSIFKSGRMPLSSMNKQISYAFGTLSLKVWSFRFESLFSA